MKTLNISKIIKNSYDEVALLNEGGASQSMQHLFSDPDLTFKELREIFTKLFTGQISIEEKCLAPETIIITQNNGKKTIKEIVENKIKDKVLSYNDETNEIEYADIIDWVKNDNTDEWLKITLEDGTSLICTPNHRIFLPDQNEDIKAEELTIADYLLFLDETIVKLQKKLKIASIEKININQARYDLTIKDKHRYFANNILVHNTDGQALAVTYKDGQVLASRNKATLKNPMTIDQLAEMFKDRDEVTKAFVNSMKDVVSAIKTLDTKQLNSIFANGQNYMAFEIIYPPLKNIIDYGNRCIIQFHGINVYDEKFNKISEDKEAADKLYKYLKEKDALKQEIFEITNHTKLQLKDSKSSKKSLKIVLTRLEKLIEGLGWNATINDYAKERFENYIVNMANKAKFDINRRSNFVSELANRLNGLIDKRVTKSELITFAKRDGINSNSQEYKEFIENIDATRSEATNTVIKPIEDLVIAAGLLLIKNLIGFMSADPRETVRKISEELEETIKDLTSKETTLDKAKLAIFKKNLKKIEDYQREVLPAEGIVFMYNGKVFKMTATFGAINQLINLLKYG